MESQVLLLALIKKVEEKLEELNDLSTVKPMRGRQGPPGKDFDIDEHKETLRAWAKEFAIKFEDFTSEQIESLKGPKGSDGRDGRDGRDGKDFVLEEHLEYFNTLKLKFTDLTEEEVNKLKLQFSHLTEEEKDSLKLKFSDLSEEDKVLLRGPRGQRGKTGEQGDSIQGPRGEKGEKGDSVRGAPGPRGVNGRDGRDGKDGTDGADAPYVTSIGVEQNKDEVEFVFEFSDGSEIKTDPVKLPRPNSYVAGGGRISSSSGGSIGTYADFASLPSGQPDGAVAITLDNHQLYIYNEGTNTWTLSSGSGGSSGLDLVSYTQFGGF